MCVRVCGNVAVGHGAAQRFRAQADNLIFRCMSKWLNYVHITTNIKQLT